MSGYMYIIYMQLSSRNYICLLDLIITILVSTNKSHEGREKGIRCPKNPQYHKNELAKLWSHYVSWLPAAPWIFISIIMSLILPQF